MGEMMPKKEERATHTEVTAAGEGRRMPSREPGLPKLPVTQTQQSGLEESVKKLKKMKLKMGIKPDKSGGGSW